MSQVSPKHAIVPDASPHLPCCTVVCLNARSLPARFITCVFAESDVWSGTVPLILSSSTKKFIQLQEPDILHFTTPRRILSRHEPPTTRTAPHWMSLDVRFGTSSRQSRCPSQMAVCVGSDHEFGAAHSKKEMNPAPLPIRWFPAGVSLKLARPLQRP